MRPNTHLADGLQMFAKIKTKDHTHIKIQRTFVPLQRESERGCVCTERRRRTASPPDYSSGAGGWADVGKDGLGRARPRRESLCDVPDGGRFPFQQPVNAGRQPAVSQVGPSEDSLATTRRWYNKPWGCCGIWERAGWCLTWISKNQLAKLWLMWFKKK